MGERDPFWCEWLDAMGMEHARCVLVWLVAFGKGVGLFEDLAAQHVYADWPRGFGRLGIQCDGDPLAEFFPALR